MTLKFWITILFQLAFCLLPTGCVLFSIRVNDLALKSADVIRVDSDLSKLLGTRLDIIPSFQRIIEISLTSKSNFGEIASDHELNLGAHIFFCADGPGNGDGDLISWPGIFFQGLRVGDINEDKAEIDNYKQAEKREFQKTGHFAYQIYAWQISPPSKAFRAYNLVTDRRDLCVQIRGGNMLGKRFETNVITVRMSN